ncbi:SMP-30/gluconolactonase/LRE family protein [Palleronia sp. LCG004]|uniref:SMP-30/gluconolactonase/LRE family protein n=1 Tax=Palleronia sp. LCG004 TaxID=3079304 RepID=UPI0029437CC6|nr:SMP-30/gluconolactonase/LRE family protein [Palleronia sp. LCG004]WOI55525.1 SMP-30/gluconolactonase/LRE family protein [Palleronia sp. LCG004]
MFKTEEPQVHENTRCLLGEGGLWHPERQQFFWCDILSKRVLSHVDGRLRAWEFSGHVSTLGWIDRDHLLVAGAGALVKLNVETNARETITPLEDDKPGNRPNDGRADPEGGFWVSTMSLRKETGAGALYRYHRGEVRQLKAGMSIPNTICFTPDGSHAFFTDTPTRMIMQWKLGPDGWPEGKPETWLNLRGTDYFPDGAICDSAGNLWSAQWGAGRVACYSPQAEFLQEIALPGKLTTCPALGGPDLDTLHVTTAAVGLDEPTIATEDGHGRTFTVATDAKGQAEHRVNA